MNLGAQQRLFSNNRSMLLNDTDKHHHSVNIDPGRTHSLQLCCMIGFTGSYRQTLLCHPILSDICISAIGPVIVISNLSESGEQRFLRDHQQNIVAINISRSGNYIVSGQIRNPTLDPDTCICLWDFSSGSLLNKFGYGRGQVKLLEFTNDDRWIGCCTDEYILYIWEIQSGDLVLTAPGQQYSCMKFGPVLPSSKSRRNRSYVLYACSQNSVQISTFHYDIKTMQYETNRRRCDVPGRCALIRTFTCCVLDGDNQYLYCGTTAGDVCMFDLGSGQYRSTFQVCSGGVQSMIVCDNVMIIGGGDGSLYKYERTGPQWILHSEMRLSGSITSLTVSSDMKEVISGTNMSCIYRSSFEFTYQAFSLYLPHITINNTNVLFDLQSLLVQRSSPGPVSQLAFPRNAQDRIAATISTCGSVIIWDRSDYSIITTYQGPCPGTTIIFDSNDGAGDSDLLTGWEDGSIRLYSSTEECIRWQICDAARGAITAIQQHEKHIIVAGSKSGAIRIWNKCNRTMISEYVAHSSSPIIDVILDKARPYLIHSVGLDRRLVSYDYRNKLYISSHQLNHRVYQSISQRNTGELEIAAGLGDGCIMIYDLDLSEPVCVHETDIKRCIIDLDFSANGRYLVTAQAPDQIVVYEFTADQQLACRAYLSLHSSRITSVRFSPDQHEIISSCQDSSICILKFTSNL